MQAKTSSSTTTTVLVVLVLIFTFPIWIGIIGGLFGAVMGVFGAVFGVMFGVFGAVIGTIAGIFGWIFDFSFHGPWGCDFDFFQSKFFLIAILIIVAVVALRRR